MSGTVAFAYANSVAIANESGRANSAFDGFLGGHANASGRANEGAPANTALDAILLAYANSRMRANASGPANSAIDEPVPPPAPASTVVAAGRFAARSAATAPRPIIKAKPRPWWPPWRW